MGRRRIRQVQLVWSLASHRHFYFARLHHERAVLLQALQRLLVVYKKMILVLVRIQVNEVGRLRIVGHARLV